MSPRSSVQYAILASFLLLIIPQHRVAADCIDYSQHPHFLSGVPTGRGGYGVALRDGYAYLTEGQGLEVIDISNPLRPVQVAFVPTSWGGADVGLAGDYAYVSDLYSGILVINIADPMHPFIAGSVPTFGAAGGLWVKGIFIYVSTLANTPTQSKLQVFSIAADPTTPTLVGMTDIPNWGFDVVVRDNVAYVACAQAGLVIVDVAYPTDPEVVGQIRTPNFAVGVEKEGDYAYVADQTSIQIINVAAPDRPRIVGRLPVPSLSCSVIMHNGYLFVGDYEAGVLFVDVMDPAHPSIIGHVDTPAMAYVIAVEDGLAYVADWNSLQVIDIGTDLTDVTMTTVDTPGCADGIAVQGSYAYIADGESGLEVASLSGIILGRVDTPGFGQDVVVNGTTAYMADGPGGFHVIDVSRPAHPTLLGTLQLSGYAYKVAIDAGRPRPSSKVDYVYVVDWNALLVISVSGDRPTLVASLATGSRVDGLAVYGGRAYVADTQRGLIVVNVADPAHPQIISTLPFQGGANSVSLYGSRVCVVHQGSLSVVDVSDAAHPFVVGTVAVRGSQSVTVSGDYAYMNAMELGVFIVDLSDPGTPVVIGQLDTPGYAYDCVVSDCGLYVADQISGIEIAPAQQASGLRSADVIGASQSPPRPAFLVTSPNPAREGSTLRFETEAVAAIDLRIFDAGGRCVRQLASGVVDPGSHETPWNGRDDFGRSVPSGTYFVRLRCGDRAATDRLILLR